MHTRYLAEKFYDYIEQAKKEHYGKKDTALLENNEKDKLKEFLIDIYTYKDQISLPSGKPDILNAGIVSMQVVAEEGLCRSMSFPVKKINPVRETTVSLTDILLNIGREYDTFLRTPKFSYSKEYKCTERNIYGIYNMSFDIDDIIPDNTEDCEIPAFLFRKYPFLGRFKPNYIINSGNHGVHVYYLFTSNVINQKPKLKELIKSIGYIIDADVTKRTINNCLRVPYTINTKSRKKAVIVYKNKERYDFLELLEKVKEYYKVCCHVHDEDSFTDIVMEKQKFIDNYCDIDGSYPNNVTVMSLDNYFKKNIKLYEEENSNKKNKETFLYSNCRNKLKDNDKKKEKLGNNLKQFYSDALKLVYINIKRNGGRVVGYRNNHLYTAAICMFHLHIQKNKAEKRLRQINNKFIIQLSQNQIKGIVKCVYLHKYRLSASNLKDMLGLDDCMAENSSICFNYAEKKMRKRHNNKILAKKRKKERASAKKRKKIQCLIRKMYLNTAASYREIAKLANCSKSTVCNVVKMFRLQRIKKSCIVKGINGLLNESVNSLCNGTYVNTGINKDIDTCITVLTN